MELEACPITILTRSRTSAVLDIRVRSQRGDGRTRVPRMLNGRPVTAKDQVTLAWSGDRHVTYALLHDRVIDPPLFEAPSQPATS